MEFTKPTASAVPSYEKGDVIGRTRRLVLERGMSGLASNTKWNRLITAMRTTEEWKPGYRWKCIDGEGYVSMWECEWVFHLPFPFITVHWLDISFVQELRRGPLAIAKTIDHSDRIEAMLRDIGFVFQKGRDFFRVHGYYPYDFDRFEDQV